MGRRRVFGIVLTVSLAVNLFAIGILIGAVATGGGPWMHRGLDPWAGGFQASPAFMALEPESRQLAIERFQENEDTLREHTRAVRRAQRDVVRAMSAEPFDPTVAGEALQQLRLQTDAIQATVHNYLIDLSRNLTHDERERLGRSIFRGPAYRTPLAGDPFGALIPAG